jgi:hypothetical protein
MRGIRTKNRAAGARRGLDITEESARFDARIAQEVRAYRLKHPHSREYSTRRLAANLATKLGRPQNTIRNRLAVLRLK